MDEKAKHNHNLERDKIQAEKEKQAEKNTLGPMGGGAGSAPRQSARAELRDRRRRAKLYLNELEALDQVIHWDNLSDQQEEAMWHLISRWPD